jgi:uncharacterized membrane protein
MQSSTGLPPRTAAALAYSGWWVTGGIFWLVEREDRFVRRHAAHAFVVFGLIALLIVTLAGLALVSLTFLPEAFGVLMFATAAMSVGGVVLWASAIWSAVNGEDWKLGARLLEPLGTRVSEHPRPERRNH